MTAPRKGTKAFLEQTIQRLENENAHLRQEATQLRAELAAVKAASEPCEKCGHEHKAHACDRCSKPAESFYCEACDGARCDKSDFDEHTYAYNLLHELIKVLREPARDADEKRWQKLDIDRIVDQATRL